MKMKKLVVALALVTSASLSYAEPENNNGAINSEDGGQLNSEQKGDNRNTPVDKQSVIDQAVGLLSTSDVSGIVALAQQYPDFASAIYEALAKANPQGAPALAAQLTTAAPSQATTIALAMVSGVNGDVGLSLAIIDAVNAAAPDQASDVNHALEDAVLNMFSRSVAHAEHYNDTPATVNNQQQLAENIQSRVGRGITQDQADKLINEIIHESKGSVGVPVKPSTPVSPN